MSWLDDLGNAAHSAASWFQYEFTELPQPGAAAQSSGQPGDNPPRMWRWNQQLMESLGLQNLTETQLQAFFNDPISAIASLAVDSAAPPAAAATDPNAPPPSAVSALASNTTVPLPFDKQYFDARTEAFGDVFQGATEYGNDYGMPEGTEVRSPFAGVISTEDQGKSNWGKRIFVTLPNGWKFAVGHMHGFAVMDGATISKGALLGYSGGNQSDPSSGFSSGDHIELQMINPNGQYVDPYPMLQQIYQPGGTTFKNLAGGGFLSASEGVDAPPPDQFYWTPDKHKIIQNSPEDRWYNMINSVWKKVYGANAPFYAAQALAQTGVQNMDQVQTILEGMPSDIQGLTLGQRERMKTQLQAASDKWIGRPVPDALLKQLAAEGKTNPIALEEWFHSHSSSDIPRDQYGVVFDAMNQWTQSLTGQPPHPDLVVQGWKQAGGGAGQSTPPPAAPFVPVEGQPGLVE